MRGLIFILALTQAASAAVTGDVRLRTGAPDTPSERAYLTAARGFQAGHWATAERWLGEFARLHPDSRHRAQAVLLRAQALYQMGEFNKAAAEISKGENAAGELADGYLYWKAECRLRLEQFDAASARRHAASGVGALEQGHRPGTQFGGRHRQGACVGHIQGAERHKPHRSGDHRRKI